MAKPNKVKPDMRIVKRHDEDGWNEWQEIEYSCPLCHRVLRGWYTAVGCEDCGVFFDWGEKEPQILVINKIGEEPHKEQHKEVPQWFRDFVHFDMMFKKVDL